MRPPRGLYTSARDGWPKFSLSLIVQIVSSSPLGSDPLLPSRSLLLGLLSSSLSSNSGLKTSNLSTRIIRPLWSSRPCKFLTNSGSTLKTSARRFWSKPSKRLPVWRRCCCCCSPCSCSLLPRISSSYLLPLCPLGFGFPARKKCCEIMIIIINSTNYSNKVYIWFSLWHYIHYSFAKISKY